MNRKYDIGMMKLEKQIKTNRATTKTHSLKELHLNDEFVLNPQKIKTAILFGKQYDDIEYHELFRVILDELSIVFSFKTISFILDNYGIEGTQTTIYRDDITTTDKSTVARFGDYYVAYNKNDRTNFHAIGTLFKLFGLNEEELIIHYDDTLIYYE